MSAKFPLLLLLILLITYQESVGQTQIWNPDFSIGTVTGNYSYALNQTPEQLVEITPAGIPNTGFYYQWEYCYTPTGTFVSAPGTSAAAAYSPGPVTQTTYYRRRTWNNTMGTKISNVIKLSVVSNNWEDFNYVREHQVITTNITSWTAVDQLPIGQKLQATTYFDGIGRPIQKVGREMATPSQGTLWGDAVQFFQYDAMGREPAKYLPYITTSQSGKYKTAPLTEQPQYYTSVYNETSAFSSVAFDNSPLNRVTNVKESGTSWAASAGNTAAYDTNTDSENVKILSLDYVQGSAPLVIGSYPANTLHKMIYTDVNGKRVMEYNDKSGKLILRKVQIDDAPSVAHAGWACTYNIYDDYGLLRYQLQPEAVKFLDANAWSFSAVNGPQVLAGLCSQYYYDEKRRTTWKKAPDAAPLNMLYDIRDRLVFTQDGNQGALPTPQWTATLYDDLDRPVITTLYNTAKTIATLQSDIAAAVTYSTITTAVSNPVIDKVVTTRNAGTTIYSASNSVTLAPEFTSLINDEFVVQIDPAASTPSANITNVTLNNPISSTDLNNSGVTTILKYFFYDNYAFNTVKSFDNTYTNLSAYSGSDPNVQPIAASARTTGMATGSLTRVLGSSLFLANTNYFDEKGRPIQALQDNIKTGTDITTLQYHFDGRLLSSCLNHTAPGSDYVGFITLTKYFFDQLGRASSVQKQFGNNPLKTVSSFDYDDMGRVKTKHLDPGYTAGGNADLESLNYSFNIHNQIIGINKDYALKTPATYNKWGHFFGLYLGFDNKDSIFTKAELNGQVTGLLWNTQGDDAQRKYDYRYDNAGRLINASYTEQQHPGDGYGNAKMDFSVTGTAGQITYDYNGNLLTMLQKGVVPGTSAPITIDDLRYAYNSYSNKLQSVTDQMTMTAINGTFGDFKKGNSTTAPDYVYDNNGNIVIDLNKNVQSLNNGAAGTNGISYNFLDKPDQIRIVGKGTIKIVYNADGEKLQRVFIPEAGGSSTITHYLGAYIYQETANLTLSSTAPFSGSGASLSYINFEDGRIRVVQPVSLNNGYDALSINGNITLPNGKMGVFDYFVLDYQQNVRMILTEETHSASNTCTMEISRSSVEDPVFGQTGSANEVETTRFATPAGWQASNLGSYVSRLGNIAAHNIGPNTLQKVMAGDQVSASVQYYYAAPPGNTNPNIVSSLLSGLAQVIGTGNAATSIVKSNATAITNQLAASTAFVNAVQPSGSGPAVPQAYLTILFFDERFNFIAASDGGVAQQQVASSVTSAGAPLGLSYIKAPKNGYVFIYVSNRSDQDVYFDNLVAGIVHGNIIEENHYFAFGLKIAAISSRKLSDNNEGQIKNQYQWQGDYSEYDDVTGWNGFKLRSYDTQVGRFTTPDPYNQFTSPYTGMGNDPINNVDPNGGWAIDFGTIGQITGSALADRALITLAGAGIGFSIDKLTGGNGWTGAAIGGGLGLAGTFIPPFEIGNLLGGVQKAESYLSIATHAANLISTTVTSDSYYKTTQASTIEVPIPKLSDLSLVPRQPFTASRTVNALTMSDNGFDFLARQEGIVLHPYNDSRGFATIGVGHLIGYRSVTHQDRIDWAWLNTRAQALDLFRNDLQLTYEPAIRRLIRVPVTQAQYDAIVSFTYNVGVGSATRGTGFAGSLFLRELNAGRPNGDLMLRYRRPPEIISRRQREARLFNTGHY